MSAFTKIVATTALTLAASTASAALISETVSFGTQGSSADVSIGTLNETLSVAGFNTALGTLTGVTVTVFGQLDSTGSSQNVSAADGRAEVAILIYNDWQVTTSSANDHIFQAADFSNAYLSDESSPAPTFDLKPGTADDTFTYALTSGELSQVLGGVNMAAFNGSSVDFNFTGFAQTEIQNEVASGTGFFTNSFATGSWGQVTVDYTYNAVIVPPPSTVPVPGTLALLGLGLLAMRARKSA
jgi:hypothetical protein